MMGGAASNPDAVKFLEVLLEGVPDTQYLEIRTFRKGSGARKKFYSIAQLSQVGVEVATQLPRWQD
jgi:hypothetical protein